MVFCMRSLLIQSLLMLCLIFPAPISKAETEQLPIDNAVNPHQSIMSESTSTSTQPVTSGDQGRVISSQIAGGYIYLEIEQAEKTLWVAGTPIEVMNGDTVSWELPMRMENFHSKSLDRTFNEILFVNQIAILERAADIKPAVENPFKGKVLSVENVANYTYLEVQTPENKDIWLAVPVTQLTVGDTVSWSGGTMMPNFTSPTLNRTFEEIFFVTGVRVEN